MWRYLAYSGSFPERQNDDMPQMLVEDSLDNSDPQPNWYRNNIRDWSTVFGSIPRRCADNIPLQDIVCSRESGRHRVRGEPRRHGDAGRDGSRQPNRRGKSRREEQHQAQRDDRAVAETGTTVPPHGSEPQTKIRKWPNCEHFHLADAVNKHVSFKKDGAGARQQAQNSARRRPDPSSDTAEEISDFKNEAARTNFINTLSSMYAVILVVMALCMSLSEALTKAINIYYFEGFYLYLYVGTIAFLIYIYGFLLRGGEKGIQFLAPDDLQDNSPEETVYIRHRTTQTAHHTGSLYLRMGAIGFGIGGIIYSALKLSVFVEMTRSSECFLLLNALVPVMHIFFTFGQLYFIFHNSKMCVHKFKSVARFGLMHMLAANLCVWVSYLVKETIEELGEVASHTMKMMNDNDTACLKPSHFTVEQLQAIMDTYYLYPVDCFRKMVMINVSQQLSPFLFPCIIEYSLIVSGIIFIMWKNIGHGSPVKVGEAVKAPTSGIRIDTDNATKGLFLGLVVFVLTVINIIIFIIMVNEQDYRHSAVIASHSFEIVAYLVDLVCIIMGLFQVRKLRFEDQEGELDTWLLFIAQLGVFMYAGFSIIAAHKHLNDVNSIIIIVANISKAIQVSLQTLLILDASRRYSDPDGSDGKPGRQLVTYLIVSNFSLWALSTFSVQKVQANTVQLDFYGLFTWTIITHLCTPLSIFYRFHSTVCLFEIWKRAYKPRKS